NRTQAPDQVGRGNADDAATGEEPGERRGGEGVRGGVEGRHQDRAVGDVEVRVRRGQARAVVDYGGRHRESFDVKSSAVLIAHRAQAVEVVAEHEVVHVGRVVLEDGDDGVGGD